MTDEAAYVLQAAIIEQAIQDMEYYIKRRDFPQVKVIENFFRSQWGEALTDNHGEDIIRRVNQKYRR